MDNFQDIFSAVAKIVVCVAGSAVASSQIPRPKETLKDFGFIITNVLLPCLFSSQMVEAVSLEMLKKSYILFIAAGGALVIAFLGATVLTKVVFPDNVRFSTIDGVSMRLVTNRDKVSAKTDSQSQPNHRLLIHTPQHITEEEVMRSLVVPDKETLANTGYRTCITVATMLQNTFVLPMSLLQSLVNGKGSGGGPGTFEWVDLQQVTSYIFFFNIIITIAFWVIGPLLVRGGARRTAEQRHICEVITRHNNSLNKISQSTQTHKYTGVNINCADLVSLSDPPEPYSWRHSTTDSIVIVREGSVSTAGEAVDDGFYAEEDGAHTLSWEKIKGNVAPLINAPLCSMFVGILVGLIPFTRTFFLDGQGRVLFDVTKLIGDGTVAASLFLLGCNLSTDFSVIAAKATTFKHFSHSPLLPEKRESDSETEFEDDEMETAGDNRATISASSLGTVARVIGQNHSFTQFDAADVIPNKSFVKGCDPALIVSLGMPTEEQSPESETGNKRKKVKTPAPPPNSNFNQLPSLGTLYSLEGINKKFIFVLLLTRLVILPAILMTVAYFLIETKAVASIADPCGNLLLLTLLVELFAPTALNSALLFNMEGFMIREYSKALLFEYTASVITLIGWLLLTVQLVQGDSCPSSSAVTQTTAIDNNSGTAVVATIGSEYVVKAAFSSFGSF